MAKVIPHRAPQSVPFWRSGLGLGLGGLLLGLLVGASTGAAMLLLLLVSRVDWDAEARKAQALARKE